MATRFMVRVELHDATWQDYTYLHSAMTQHGYSQTIVSDSGISYQLPPAEYHYLSTIEMTPMQIVERVRGIAATTGRNNAVVVSATENIAWNGLNPAENRYAG